MSKLYSIISYIICYTNIILAHYMVLHITLHYISSGLIDCIRHLTILTRSITSVITIYTLFLLHYIDLPVSLHGFNFKLHGLT